MGTDPSKPVGTPAHVLFLKDPYGNSYGYSTIAALAEQTYRAKVATDPAATRDPKPKGYNSTFDLWSTSGKTLPPGASASGDVTNTWIKNW